MIIRKAKKEDIPFIIKGIFAIESTGKSNTFSNLFETDNETAYHYLEQFFLDEENFDTELSLNTYTIAEFDGQPAGMCALIHTDANYYQNKGELFPIHLKENHLDTFIKNAKTLPDIKASSENKHFIEYIFTDDHFRNKGIAKKLIQHQIDNSNAGEVFINVLENNLNALKYYLNLGFTKKETLIIDRPENQIFPDVKKILLSKNIKN
ncbi:GNAT family N-acetyltransferase [Chryseobacterium mucoviscidosis]|uniref:GNAT family N-acetyltransferase n=1 Tax=Chryseobacterium mucoviscidosis TaxID=1945581 RepID=UPI0031DED325